MFSSSSWPAHEIASGCIDLVDRIGRHLWAWSHGGSIAYSPEHRSKQEYSPVYLLDEDRSSGRWALKGVATFGAEIWITYFQLSGQCEPYFVGPARQPLESFATTIRGRFLSYGFGPTTFYEPPDFNDHFLDDVIAGRYSGDTVYVGVGNASDPADAEAVDRFNRAVVACGDLMRVISPERLVNLYLECIYPCERIFIISDAEQLDALYRFVWSRPVDPYMDLTQEEWSRLLEPGVKEGRMLNILPFKATGYRYPLPSVIMDKYDGRWTTTTGDFEDEDNIRLIRNVFETDWKMLFQLEFSLSRRTGLIEEVRILRLLDLFDLFTRNWWER